MLVVDAHLADDADRRRVRRAAGRRLLDQGARRLPAVEAAADAGRRARARPHRRLDRPRRRRRRSAGTPTPDVGRRGRRGRHRRRRRRSTAPTSSSSPRRWRTPTRTSPACSPASATDGPTVTDVASVKGPVLAAAAGHPAFVSGPPDGGHGALGLGRRRSRPVPRRAVARARRRRRRRRAASPTVCRLALALGAHPGADPPRQPRPRPGHGVAPAPRARRRPDAAGRAALCRWPPGRCTAPPGSRPATPRCRRPWSSSTARRSTAPSSTCSARSSGSGPTTTRAGGSCRPAPCGTGSAERDLVAVERPLTPTALRAVGEIGGHVTGVGEGDLHRGGAGMTAGFVPPPYPYDRLAGLVEAAAALPGGAVDCSIGTPCDPPPPAVIEALGHSGAERGYPPSIGSPAYREAAAGWMAPPPRRRGRRPSAVAACVGTKEFVASAPQYLRLRTPERDTVLHPAIAYPTYAMGATLAGCRAVAYDDLDDIDPADAGARPVPVGQQPGEPPRRPRGPRRGRRVGREPRRAGALRRVLRRVHLGRRRPRAARSSSTAPTACSPSTRCRSGRTSPAPGPAATPATPSWCASSARSASTPAAWCRARSRRPPSWPGPTTPTSTPSATCTAAGSHRLRQVARRLRRRRADARGRLLPVGAGARRRRLGPGRARWPSAPGIIVTPGETFGPAGAGLRAGRRRATRRPHRAAASRVGL